MAIRFQAGTTAAPSERAIRFVRPLTITSLTAIEVLRATAGVGETITDRDAIIEEVTSAPQVTDYQMRVETFGGVAPVMVAWSSSNEAVATVDAEGYVMHVADGTATITATINGVDYDEELTFSTTPDAATGTLTGYMEGSLSKDAVDAVDTRLAGKSAATSLRIFTTRTHTGTPAYVRNSSCWCADVDLTCISPWNSASGVNQAGTLVSPRHIVFAAHYQIPVGATVRFVAADGTVVDRVMTDRQTHPIYSPYYPDITVGVLASDVSEGINFAKVLPADYADRLPALNFNRALPALCLDQEEKALVTDFGRVATSGSIYASFVAPNNLNYAKRLEFYEDKIGGDSGNPAFLILNGELVLLTVWTFGGAGSGTFLTAHIDAINTMMTSLGGGYQLTTADLSGYNDYS